MPSDRTRESLPAKPRSLSSNVIINLVSQGAIVIASLVAVPVLVKQLGIARFGMLTLFWSAIAYFMLLDFGLGKTVAQLLSYHLGNVEIEKPDKERYLNVYSLVQTAFLTTVGIGLVAGLCLALLTPWLANSAIDISSDLRPEILTSLWILAGTLPVLTCVAVPIGVLSAIQKFDAINIVKVPSNIWLVFGPMLIGFFTTDLRFAIASIALSRFLGLFALSRFCLNALPALRSIETLNVRKFVNLLRTGGWIAATNTLGIFILFADRLFVLLYIPTTLVAFYTSPYEVMTRLWVLPDAILRVIFPAFAANFMRDKGKTQSIFENGIRYIFIALFPFILISISFADEILYVWLGSDFAREGAFVLRWIAFGVLVHSIAQVPYVFLQGIGRGKLTTLMHVVEAPFYFMLLYQVATHDSVGSIAIVWTVRTVLNAVFLFASVHYSFSEYDLKQPIAYIILGLTLLLSFACILELDIVFRLVLFGIVGALYLTALIKVLTSQEDKQTLIRQWQRLRQARV